MTSSEGDSQEKRTTTEGPEDQGCLLCGGTVRDWFSVPCDWRRAGSPPYQVVRCARCDFGQVAPRPERDEIAGFYRVDDYYTHGDHEEPRRARRDFLERLRVHIAWRFDRGIDTQGAVVQQEPGKKGTLCEIGCGSGMNLEGFAELGFDVVGVEPDPEARAQAKQRGITVHEGTGEELPSAVKERLFDTVLIIHVLEHCLDPALVLEQASALLDRDGLLVLETPNNRALGRYFAGKTWNWLDVPRHLNFFTRQSLEGLCRRVGLEVVDTQYNGYARQFDGPWIREEQRIWDRFKRLDGAPPFFRRNSRLEAWLLLAATALARPDRKYDSVRVVARRPRPSTKSRSS